MVDTLAMEMKTRVVELEEVWICREIQWKSLGCLGYISYLGGGFKYLLFSPLFGEDSHFEQYFSIGLKPPTSYIPSMTLT